MRRAISIRQELEQVQTVEGLTGVFESVASIKIARIRNRVVASKAFFSELWQTYYALRINPKEQLQRTNKKTTGRSVLVAVTTEGKLSGDIGNQVIDKFVEAYRKLEKVDVIVLGAHGASQLEQQGIPVEQMFHLPDSDVQFSVTDMIGTLEAYDQITVFYQTYESLRVQRVGRIELVTAVREMSEQVDGKTDDSDEIVSSEDYILEPGITEIADYLESLMMGVALYQVLMESKLAQYASRFNAMNAAKHRAREMGSEYSLLYHRAKRSEGDERLKEIMKIVKGQVT